MPDFEITGKVCTVHSAVSGSQTSALQM